MTFPDALKLQAWEWVHRLYQSNEVGFFDVSEGVILRNKTDFFASRGITPEDVAADEADHMANDPVVEVRNHKPTRKFAMETLRLVETFRKEISYVSLDDALGLPSGSVERISVNWLMRRLGKGPLIRCKIHTKTKAVPPGWTGEALIDPDKEANQVRLIGPEMAAAGLPMGLCGELRSFCPLRDGFLILDSTDRIGFVPANDAPVRALRVTRPIIQENQSERRHGLIPVLHLRASGHVIPVPMYDGWARSVLAFLHLGPERESVAWSKSPSLAPSWRLIRSLGKTDLITLRAEDWPDFFLKPEFPFIASAALTDDGPLIYSQGARPTLARLPAFEGVALLGQRGELADMPHIAD